MKKALVWSIVVGLMLTTSLGLGAPIANDRFADRQTELAYNAMSRQPLSVQLSASEVHVGESIWLTVSGGVEPYVLVAVENRIQVVSRGKNTYQISGLATGVSRLTIGDSEKNSTITKVITVLPKR
jgi:hypothetical protein